MRLLSNKVYVSETELSKYTHSLKPLYRETKVPIKLIF